MLIETLALALFISFFLGGKLNRLSRLRLKAVLLVILALAMQGFVYWTAAKRITPGPQWVYPGMHIASYILLLLFAFLNRKLAGMPLLALGIALNGLVIAFNRGQMPVDPTYLPEASRQALLGPGTHSLLTDGTRLSFLADRFYISIPYLGRQLFSWGDVFIDLGVFILILATMINKDYDYSFFRSGYRP